ncbi:MAG: cyclase family protein [Acidobacteria bacterium]|nr:cyclase family protein [Acidobacteriota bacterium]
MRIYDLSAAISAAMPTYPGDPGVVFEQWAALDKGDPANVTMLHFGAHTGTHVDAPAHFIAGTPGVESLSLETLIGRARVIELPPDVHAIEAEHLRAEVLEGATRVLFKTRNSAFWGDADRSFRKDFTYLAPDGARALVELGVRLVGIDYLSVEKFGSQDFQTHITLLERGVIIVEGLDLREVSAGDYELLCLPLRLADGTGDGAPARAVLRTLE